MSGLMIKDLCILRRTGKSYLAVVVIYGAAALTGVWSADFFAGILTVLVTMMPVNLFSWDIAARWDGYCMALPVSRRQTVAARYLVALLTLVLAFLISLAMGGALLALGHVDSMGDYLLATCTAMVSGCLLEAVIMPILYQLGPEKSRVALVAVFGGVFAIVLVLGKGGVFDKLDGLPQPSVMMVLAVFALVVAVLLAVSFLLSCRIYQRKEA